MEKLGDSKLVAKEECIMSGEIAESLSHDPMQNQKPTASKSQIPSPHHLQE